MKENFFKLGVTIVASLLLLQGCTDYKEEIKVKTNEFLSAYFNGDYQKAMTFCTDSLGGEISKMLSGFEALDPSIQEMVKRQASNLTTEIVSVNKSENRDTILVNYKLSLPFSTQDIDNSISFVKEDKEWKVAGLGAAK
ncbi:MAG: hypothetical protein QMB82_08230 [Bacteroidales bacterium]